MSEAIDEIVDGLDEPQDELTEEPVTEDVTPEAKEEPQEEQQESRANQRIRQLIEEKKALESRVEGLEGLKEQVEALAKSRKEEPEKAPDFMADPKGYVDSQAQKITQTLEELQKRADEGSQQAQQQLAQMQFMQSIQGDETQFVRQTPDYYDALQYVRDQRREELEELGIDDEEEVARIINTEELQAAAVAINKGTSAAAHYYNKAKKLGYKHEETDKAAEKVDEEAARLEAAKRAQSMGGNNLPEEADIEDPDDAAWAPIEESFKEMFGVDLK